MNSEDYVRVSPISKNPAIADWQAELQKPGRCTVCEAPLRGNQRHVCADRACQRERFRVWKAGRRAAQKEGLHQK